MHSSQTHQNRTTGIFPTRFDVQADVLRNISRWRKELTVAEPVRTAAPFQALDPLAK